MAEVVIVGGGLAGSCAAIHLAKGGVDVTLLERTEGPHDKVCGEFLSGEALDELRRLGLEPSVYGPHSLQRARMAFGTRLAEAKLPFEALSLSRRLLDEELLMAAEAAGARVRRGAVVRKLTASGDLAGLELKGGERMDACAVMLATGKHDLKERKRPGAIHDAMVGIKTYLRPREEIAGDLAGRVDVAFFRGGYCGFQLVEDGRMNVCMAIGRDTFQRLGGRPEGAIEHLRASLPHARWLLEGAEAALERPLAVGRVPYGMVRTKTDNVFCLGDQAAVIPSFCGEGMGLALRSGRLAAEAYLRGEEAATFQAEFARMARGRVKAAAFLSRALTVPGTQALAGGVAAAAPRLVSVLAAATRTPAPS